MLECVRRIEAAEISDMPEVDVWCADLDDPVLSTDRCLTLLDAAERKRFGRLRRDLDRMRFARRRALRRLLLARTLGISPFDLEIIEVPGGKPRLACGSVCFSASSADWVFVLATARRSELGVDIAAQWAPAGWTRVEALGKALGCGLAIGPEEIARMDMSEWQEIVFEPVSGFVATLLVARRQRGEITEQTE